eukprot:SAG11_NODE_8376_length_1023_cov_1.252165_1_plen_79_part_10
MYARELKLSGIVQSGEVIAVINAVCTGDAQGIQEYIREQPDRNEPPLDGLNIMVVSFIRFDSVRARSLHQTMLLLLYRT